MIPGVTIRWKPVLLITLAIYAALFLVGGGLYLAVLAVAR